MKWISITLFFLLGATQDSYGALTWVDLTVTRHTDTIFTQATFDNDMNVINERLKYDNHDCDAVGVVDVPCSVRFRRLGPLRVFGATNDGLDLINTTTELDAVFDVNVLRAKIVTYMEVCDDEVPPDPPNPSIKGCGRCDGYGFILESGQPGDVYVHEYGHNVMGCGHRDDCDWNIMNSDTIGVNNALNDAECTGFGGSVYTQICGDVYDGHGGPLTVSGGPYWLTCNVTVPVGQTLTIYPGVEIQFAQGGYKITSDGTTNANGEISRIDIYSNNETNNFPTATIDGPLTINNGGELIFY